MHYNPGQRGIHSTGKWSRRVTTGSTSMDITLFLCQAPSREFCQLGDLLLTTVNYSRGHRGVFPSGALRMVQKNGCYTSFCCESVGD